MTTAHPNHFSAPLASLTRATFEVASGTSNLRLRAAAPAGYRDAELLVEGRFYGRAPEVQVEGSRVRMAYLRAFRDLCFDWRSCAAEVALSPLVPWDLLIRGGVSCLDADLSALELSSLEVSGGVSEASIRLPRPKATVRLFVLGGVDRLSLTRPADVPVSVSVTGGASELQVDTLSLGAVGGHFQWETPGFEAASARYIIEIYGGVSGARVGSFTRTEAPASSPHAADAA